jgi:hypothetical protein
MVNTAWQRKVHTNAWTDLKVGGKLLMKNDQDSLQHHKQMATMLNWWGGGVGGGWLLAVKLH